MRIFYAVQATGNGHISRANQLYTELSKYGTVDIMLSGSNYTLQPNFVPKYAIKGISLFYTKCGGIDILKTFTKNSIIQAKKDAKKLPLNSYDLVINDFDFVTAQACKNQHIKSIQFGHQASFASKLTPRAPNKDWFGEYVLNNFAVATKYIGLHFSSYDSFIFPPVIKNAILEGKIDNKGHITIYLPSVNQQCIYSALKKLTHLKFQWFTNSINNQIVDSHIEIMPVNDAMFTQSLLHCDGLITGGGFETPAEALFLNKKLMVIPIQKHYEQQCNAQALKEMGVYTQFAPNFEHFDVEILNWLNRSHKNIAIKPVNTPDIVKSVVETTW